MSHDPGTGLLLPGIAVLLTDTVAEMIGVEATTAEGDQDRGLGRDGTAGK